MLCTFFYVIFPFPIIIQNKFIDFSRKRLVHFEKKNYVGNKDLGKLLVGLKEGEEVISWGLSQSGKTSSWGGLVTDLKN